MFITVDSAGTLYQQIYQSLRLAILTGELASGACLPSTRALSHELGVSRNAVLLAYDQLRAEGYIVGQSGSGTYVASVLPDVVLTPMQAAIRTTVTDAPTAPRLSAYGRRVAAHAQALGSGASIPLPAVRYDFRYGLPDTDDFPHAIWRRLLARHARAASPHSLRYGPPEGHAALRTAIADYLRRARAVLCNPDQIVVVNGSQQALDLAARVLLDPGDGVVIEEPHYQGARQAFLAAGARLYAIPVDKEGLNTAELPHDAAAVRLAYITPSHQFPSGAILSLTRRLALLAWAEQANVYVVEDDYDSEYRYEGRPLESVQGLDRHGRVIYVGTFSKVLFPALRLGYLVLPRALVQPFTAAKWLTDRHTQTLDQEVLTDFIREGHFERHLRRSRTRHAARRAALLEALTSHLGTRIEVSGANAGMHLLVWLHDVAPSQIAPLLERAARVSVGLYAVTPYYLHPPQRAGLLLGYTSMNETEIHEGIRRFASVLP